MKEGAAAGRRPAEEETGMEEAPIVVQGAMEVETEEIIRQMRGKKEEPFGPFRCVRGLLDGHPLVVSETQWGMANAAALAALAIARYAPRAILSQGTAGAHDPSLEVYDIVVGERTVNESAWQSHYRAAGEGAPMEELKKLGVFAWSAAEKRFRQEVYHAGDPELLDAARRAAPHYARGRVAFGTIGTSDSWNCAVDRVRFLQHFYGSACEEMEGDAVAQIAQSFGVPFLAVRIISNSILKNQDPWDLGTGPACQGFVLSLLRAFWAAQ
jgi:adenosylhomocysteine nucleosidase